MGCPHGDVVGQCPKCCRAKDNKPPPDKDASKSKTKGKLRIVGWGVLFCCKYCRTAPKFRIVRVSVHKTHIACLNCGKEQKVSRKFNEKDDGDIDRNAHGLVSNAVPRSKQGWRA